MEVNETKRLQSRRPGPPEVPPKIFPFRFLKKELTAMPGRPSAVVNFRTLVPSYLEIPVSAPPYQILPAKSCEMTSISRFTRLLTGAQSRSAGRQLGPSRYQGR